MREHTEARFIFAIMMAIGRAWKLSGAEAMKIGRETYRDFRRDNPNLVFGDPRWDWGPDGARIIAQEYALVYGDALPPPPVEEKPR